MESKHTVRSQNKKRRRKIISTTILTACQCGGFFTLTDKKRPLGIPTMYDRAKQTLYALTLEPIAETKGDNISFDFLGWTFRKFKDKLIVKPSKSSIKSLISKCSNILLKQGKASTQSEIIRRLNQVIRGWTNDHRHTVANQVFSNINNTLYYLLYYWAKHRHLNKNKWWRLNRYWNEKKNKTTITECRLKR